MAFNPQEHMMPLKGKDYLQVMWRLVWFREDHPDWGIHTTMIEHVNDSAVFKAEIVDATTRCIVSTGYGSESVKDFKDYIEKAETKAVGRALAMLGYGTQFAPELDEGERIVDSPVEFRKAEKPKEEEKPKEYLCSRCGKKITKEIGGERIAGKVYCRPCVEEIKKNEPSA